MTMAGAVTADEQETASTGLLVLQLLSDRNGQPGALLVHGHGHSPELLAALADSGLAALAERLPCLIASGSPPELIDALAVATLPADALAAADAQPGAALPAAIHWLPGDWYLQPPPQATGQHGASRALALKLVQLVAADADTHEIEDVFRRDSSLSYHLLRLVNSVAMGLNRHVTSFSQAIILIGRQQLRRWLNFILFAARDDDPRSPMLLARVAVRARSMELLAKAAGLDRAQQDQAFMVGMFSLLGVLFGQPLEAMLQPLKLSETLQAALLHQAGPLGQLLLLVQAAEQANPDLLAQGLRALDIRPGAFNQATVAAHQWMLDAVHDSGSSPHA